MTCESYQVWRLGVDLRWNYFSVARHCGPGDHPNEGEETPHRSSPKNNESDQLQS